MAFIKFIAKYGKSYASKEEYRKRFQHFLKTYNTIKETNEIENLGFTLAINEHADLSEEEFHQELPIDAYNFTEYDNLSFELD